MKNLFISIITLAFLVCTMSQATASAQDSTKTKGLQVSEAKLGKDVADKLLSGEDSTFAVNSKVYLWLKIAGGSMGDSITVIWKHEDFNYSTTLGIGGSPWRTWAWKTISVAGEWTVTVKDSEGTVLGELTFKVE